MDCLERGDTDDAYGANLARRYSVSLHSGGKDVLYIDG